MLDVRLGDHGPRVVLLLVVDGILGPKTETAVHEARP